MDGASLLRARVARGILFAALGGTFWGFSGTCAQLLTMAYGLDPGWIICIRLPFAALLFLVASAVRERDRLIAAVRDPKTLLGIVLFAIFGILLTQYSYLTAISLTNAGTGTVMERLGLVLLTILVCAMARRLPHVREVVGVLLAVAGTFLIATKGSFDGLAIPPEALVWGFLLACGFVGYTLLPEKLLAKWGSFIVTGLGMLVAGVIICAVEQPWSVPVEFSPGMVAALAAMVVLGTFLAYLFYLQGVKEAGAMRAGLVGCIEPVAATVFSAVWLKTAVTWADIVGMMLIIGMVVLVTVKPKDEKRGASGLSQNQG
ncbi:MAG TPA: EamA family transporter [Candidatus Aphodovivens avicola]|nr:EamA family transporter [Candidatus Aphodovivens avicola]